eukprot:TRINITY_DN16476_c0_g1_i1.p1 TRINITY_DN16476_c0_g1~~TRINITY_DN16476_c0_g1_i1.p1  ORF type:complete len:314 (-),score=43.31 TRINITY_DN16476_c0_g1_i1:143-1084(-)
MVLPGDDAKREQLFSGKRINRRLVAEYYLQYGKKLGTHRTGWVRKLSFNPEKKLWAIESENDRFTAKFVVLAIGSQNIPKRLNVPGEDSCAKQIINHRAQDTSTLGNGKTVIVIGAGLTAADFIIHAISEGTSIKHVFRRKVPDKDHKLAKFEGNFHTTYHEYAMLYHWMSSTGLKQLNKRLDIVKPNSEAGGSYEAFAGKNVVEFCGKGECLLSDGSGVKGDSIAVLIGTCADLSFLDKDVRDHLEKECGRITDKVDAKNHPLSVDPFTFRIGSFDSLYAIGPLAGTNFVRFGVGYSLGVAADIHKRVTRPD